MNSRLLYLATITISLLSSLVMADELTSAAAPMICAEVRADAAGGRPGL